jgi:hypothetical protein
MSMQTTATLSGVTGQTGKNISQYSLRRDMNSEPPESAVVPTLFDFQTFTIIIGIAIRL